MESETSNTLRISVPPPFLGMEFENFEQAKKYYEQYGRQLGFWIRVRDIKRSIPRSNEITGAKLVCSREGKHRPVSTVKDIETGMNTTGRSEGMNSFFDDFVTPKTNLREFVARFDQALKRIVQNEMNEDFETEHKQRVVEKGNFLLAHAAKLYTRKIYVKLVGEWAEVYKFRVEDGERTPEWHYFNVITRESVDAYKQNFLVKLDPQTLGGTCACKWFEFSGFICKHIMKVLTRLDVEWIPEQFIVGRWRKGANKVWRYDQSQLVRDDNEHADVLRLNHMCQEMQRLACRSAPYNEAYILYMEGVKDLSIKIEDVITSVEATRMSAIGAGSAVASCGAVGRSNHDALAEKEILILDPRLSQTKGRKKDAKGKVVTHSSDRIKSGIEIATQGRKRLCRSCNKRVTHDKRNCPLNPMSKQNKQSQINEDSDEEDGNLEIEDANSED